MTAAQPDTDQPRHMSGRGSGTFTEYTIPTASSSPWDIALGPDGNLWFTESAANQIGRLSTGGGITEFAIPTTGSGPKGITAGPDGNVWFTENSVNQIAVITTAGAVTEFNGLAANAGPLNIADGPDNNLWWTENGVSKVGVISYWISGGLGGNDPVQSLDAWYPFGTAIISVQTGTFQVQTPLDFRQSVPT
jgi:streptogramin lyase